MEGIVKHRDHCCQSMSRGIVENRGPLVVALVSKRRGSLRESMERVEGVRLMSDGSCELGLGFTNGVC